MRSSSSANTPPFQTALPSPFTPLVLSLSTILTNPPSGFFFLTLLFIDHTETAELPTCPKWMVHAGVPHLKEGDVPPQGGKPGWAALPNPRIGPWLRLLKNIAFSHNLVPEFEVYLSLSFPFMLYCSALLMSVTVTLSDLFLK